jgi:predicted RNase H-like nuclease (RuvC/YqgF family)
MDWSNVGAITVAIIAALGAWAAQRAAANASRANTLVSTKLDAEKEAYQRARTFDTETIERQNTEISRLREENQLLREELSAVKERLARLEHITPEIERLINERLDEDDNF